MFDLWCRLRNVNLLSISWISQLLESSDSCYRCDDDVTKIRFRWGSSWASRISLALALTFMWSVTSRGGDFMPQDESLHSLTIIEAKKLAIKMMRWPLRMNFMKHTAICREIKGNVNYRRHDETFSEKRSTLMLPTWAHDNLALSGKSREEPGDCEANLWILESIKLNSNSRCKSFQNKLLFNQKTFDIGDAQSQWRMWRVIAKANGFSIEIAKMRDGCAGFSAV